MARDAAHAIDRAVELMSDGTRLDWDDLEREAEGAEEREYLRWLRVLDQIAELHGSTVPVVSDVSSGAASASSVPHPGELGTWGKYELIEKVGEGGFGSVYRACDRELDFELAIKILHQKTSDVRLRQALIDEGRALARIRHPNVVRVLGVESNNDRVGLCMDFVRGQALEDLLTLNGPFSAAEAVLIGVDVCGALAAVHRAGFVHRDVKARNVMREQGGRNVLMDFGAGRALASQAGRSNDMTGTPLYMAPELLSGAQATAPSDIYSVGVLLYHLVTGEYPVQAATVDELRVAHRDGCRRFLSERRPDLPVRFVAVVERMLSSDPNERYLTAGAASDALSLVLRSQTEKKEKVADALAKFFKATYAVIGGAVVCLALGIFTSRSFNRVLGRAGFATETPLDWIVWGAQSAVLPVLIVVAGLVVMSHAVMLRRFVAAYVPAVQRVDDRLRQRLQAQVHRFRLDDVSALSLYVVMASSVALVWSVWYFYPILYACLDPATTAPPAQLSLLAPDRVDYKDFFREAFTFVILLASMGWLAVGKLASQVGRRLDRGMLTAGIGIIVVATIVLSVPYRLMRHAEFEAVEWNQQGCYVIGERATDTLLFCPDLSPRNRIVSKDDRILRRGNRENVFSRFSGFAH